MPGTNTICASTPQSKEGTHGLSQKYRHLIDAESRSIAVTKVSGCKKLALTASPKYPC